MYKQWCKNLKNFIDYNSDYSPNIRLQYAEELLFLTNVERYKKAKKENNDLYREVTCFINQLKNYQDTYPSIRKFIWELWGYGFDIGITERIKCENSETLSEKAKLIDLLYSTHYL